MIPWAGLLLAAVSLWAIQALVLGTAPGAATHRTALIATWLLGIATAILLSHRRTGVTRP